MTKKGKKGKKEKKATRSSGAADASKRVFVADVPIDHLKLIKGFNPRKDLGELEDLESAIVAAGNVIKEPLEVRPAKEGQDLDADNKFQIIDGHRRFELAKKLGIETVNVFVSPEYLDENKALAEAIVKNDGDIKTNLHPIDLADAVGALKERTGLKQKALSTLLGFDNEGTKVGRCLQVAALPDSVKADCRAGKITYNTVLAIAKLKEPVQKKIIPQIEDGMTADEVNARARDFAAKEGIDARKNPRPKRKAGAESHGGSASPDDSGPKMRSKKQVVDMAHLVIGVIDELDKKNADLDEDEQEDVDIWHSALCGLMFSLGLTDQIEIESAKYKKAFKALKKEYDEVQSLATAKKDAEAEKERAKKEKEKERAKKAKEKAKSKKGKGKKGKGKKGKKAKAEKPAKKGKGKKAAKADE